MAQEIAPFPSSCRAATRDQQGGDIAAINKLNAQHDALVRDPEITTRIAQYEMAYRMQSSVPELTDLSKESDKTFERYGPDAKKPGTFALRKA